MVNRRDEMSSNSTTLMHVHSTLDDQLDHHHADNGKKNTSLAEHRQRRYQHLKLRAEAAIVQSSVDLPEMNRHNHDHRVHQENAHQYHVQRSTFFGQLHLTITISCTGVRRHIIMACIAVAVDALANVVVFTIMV